MFLGACVIASLVLSSCRSGRSSDLGVSDDSLSFEGAPIVRVRLTTNPVQSCTIGTTGPWVLMADGKERGKSPESFAPAVLTRRSGRWFLGERRINSSGLSMEASAQNVLMRTGNRTYRGSLIFVPAGESKFYVHNHVDMESYLAGVVACELYDRFHPEAFRAQAVAARTFAMCELATRGRKQTFDVWASVYSQVYRGAGEETEKSRTAVRRTRGWVLAYGPAGSERIFMTQFSACNGGYVNGATVLREVKNLIPPLRGGQKDGDGRGCKYYTWKPIRVSKAVVYRALSKKNREVRKLGSLKALSVKQKTAYGRPLFLEATGPDGKSVTVRAEDVRLALLADKVTLYSMNCSLRDLGDRIEFYDGRGYGHGVGLSQWGAQEKAERGISAEKILQFYYPGAAIFRAY
jgi:stage II sporulation protein D